MFINYGALLMDLQVFDISPTKHEFKPHPEYRLHLYKYGKRKALTVQCRNLSGPNPCDQVTCQFVLRGITWDVSNEEKHFITLSPKSLSTLTMRKQTNPNWQMYYRADKYSSRCGKFRKRKKTQTGAHKKHND